MKSWIRRAVAYLRARLTRAPALPAKPASALEPRPPREWAALAQDAKMSHGRALRSEGAGPAPELETVQRPRKEKAFPSRLDASAARIAQWPPRPAAAGEALDGAPRWALTPPFDEAHAPRFGEIGSVRAPSQHSLDLRWPSLAERDVEQPCFSGNPQTQPGRAAFCGSVGPEPFDLLTWPDLPPSRLQLTPDEQDLIESAARLLRAQSEQRGY